MSIPKVKKHIMSGGKGLRKVLGYVVGDAGALSSWETGVKSNLETNGWTVTLISDENVTGSEDVAVYYVSNSASYYQGTNLLVPSTLGVLMQRTAETESFGFASTKAWVAITNYLWVDKHHPISLALGNVHGDAPDYGNGNGSYGLTDMKSGATILARDNNGNPTLVAWEKHQGRLYTGIPAPGRRVYWGAYDDPGTDAYPLLRACLEWLAQEAPRQVQVEVPARVTIKHADGSESRTYQPILRPGPISLVKPGEWNWDADLLADPFRSIARGLQYLQPFNSAYDLDMVNHTLELNEFGLGLNCTDAATDYTTTESEHILPYDYPYSVVALLRIQKSWAYQCIIEGGGYYQNYGWTLLFAEGDPANKLSLYNHMSASVESSFGYTANKWMIAGYTGLSQTNHWFTQLLLDGTRREYGQSTTSVPLTEPTQKLVRIGAGSEYAASGWWDHLRGQISWVGVWNRGVSLEEHELMARDPFGILRPARTIYGAIPRRAVRR